MDVGEFKKLLDKYPDDYKVMVKYSDMEDVSTCSMGCCRPEYVEKHYEDELQESEINVNHEEKKFVIDYSDV